MLLNLMQRVNISSHKRQFRVLKTAGSVCVNTDNAAKIYALKHSQSQTQYQGTVVSHVHRMASSRFDKEPRIAGYVRKMMLCSALSLTSPHLIPKVRAFRSQRSRCQTSTTASHGRSRVKRITKNMLCSVGLSSYRPEHQGWDLQRQLYFRLVSSWIHYHSFDHTAMSSPAPQSIECTHSHSVILYSFN